MDNKKDVGFQPLVTVGVPTYNRLNGLKDTLKCLQEQTYKNLEIIVSDNCSTELSVDEFMTEILKNDSRIRYIKQPSNIGATQNFEYVLEQANGKYFAWAADDDLCTSDFFEKLVVVIEDNRDVALCSCDVQGIDEKGQLKKIHRLDSIRADIPWAEAMPLFFRYPTSNIFFCIYGLYRTDILKKHNSKFMIGWNRYTTNSEVPFLAKMSLHGKIISIPEVLKFYRSHSDSVYHNEIKTMSILDSIMIRISIRSMLFKLAHQYSGSRRLKWKLLKTVLLPWLTSFPKEVLSSVIFKLKTYFKSDSKV